MTSMDRVHELLAQRDMSLLKLSKLSDINYSTFRTTEKRNGQLSVDTIERICRALGITMAQFFESWESEEPYGYGKH